MKRIKNIKDLELEKLRLRIKQLELEKQMNRSWEQMSNTWSSNGSGKQQHSVQNNVHFKTGSLLLNEALSYGATFLSHKLGLIAGRKAEAAAEQILEKIAGTMNSLIAKRKRS